MIPPDKYHDSGHRLRISDKRKRNQKEVMPVLNELNKHGVVTDYANQTGGGATMEQVEIVKFAINYFRKEAEYWRFNLRGFMEENRAQADACDAKVAAFEAILAEREELIGAIKELLDSDGILYGTATDEELKHAEENGFPPEIQKHAASIRRARRVIR